MQGETPTLAEILRQAARKAVLALHTAMPGEVVSYDASTQTADVRPLLRWAEYLPGQLRRIVQLPDFPDVLVCHPRAGTAGVHLPLAAGDLVLLVFCSRSLTSWRSQSSASRAADPGRALTPTPLDAAVALPLMTHDSAPWSALSGGSTINIGDDAGALDFVALAQKVDTAIGNLQSVLDAHVHSGVVTGMGSTGTLVTPAGAQSSVAASDVKVT